MYSTSEAYGGTETQRQTLLEILLLLALVGDFGVLCSLAHMGTSVCDVCPGDSRRDESTFASFHSLPVHIQTTHLYDVERRAGPTIPIGDSSSYTYCCSDIIDITNIDSSRKGE
jgi:hypothetical protein